MSDVDLTFVSTSDLLEELKKRYATTLFVAAKPERVGQANDLHTVIYSGGWLGALGAAEYGKLFLQGVITGIFTKNPPGDPGDE